MLQNDLLLVISESLVLLFVTQGRSLYVLLEIFCVRSIREHFLVDLIIPGFWYWLVKLQIHIVKIDGFL